MRYVAAYLLAVLGGAKEAPTAKDIDKILSSVGIESDPEKVKKVIADLAGKSIEEVIAQGTTKLASMPSGGGAVAAASEAPAAGAPAAAKAEKKEEKKESESEDDDMGFGLFD